MPEKHILKSITIRLLILSMQSEAIFHLKMSTLLKDDRVRFKTDFLNDAQINLK